jgi:delta 1-pyrroline-5-carboxylate dehydrogenase
LLLAVAAFGAYMEHDLVAGSAFIARTAENTARQLDQRRIVVERGAGAPAELAQGLANQGERLGEHVET